MRGGKKNVLDKRESLKEYEIRLKMEAIESLKILKSKKNEKIKYLLKR